MNTPATNKQIPDHSIMDFYNKQVYLGNQFIASYQAASSGMSEVPWMAITNAVGNARGIFISALVANCLTASDTAILRVYSNPTGLTGGAAVAPVNMRPANTNLSVATIVSKPTVSTNGTYLYSVAAGALAQSVSNLMTILDPGQSLLITSQASASSESVGAEVSYYEI